MKKIYYIYSKHFDVEKHAITHELNVNFCTLHDVFSNSVFYNQYLHLFLFPWCNEEETLYNLKLLKRNLPQADIILINIYNYPIRRAMCMGAAAVIEKQDLKYYLKFN